MINKEYFDEYFTKALTELQDFKIKDVALKAQQANLQKAKDDEMESICQSALDSLNALGAEIYLLKKEDADGKITITAIVTSWNNIAAFDLFFCNHLESVKLVLTAKSNVEISCSLEELPDQLIKYLSDVDVMKKIFIK